MRKIKITKKHRELFEYIKQKHLNHRSPGWYLTSDMIPFLDDLRTLDVIYPLTPYHNPWKNYTVFYYAWNEKELPEGVEELFEPIGDATGDKKKLIEKRKTKEKEKLIKKRRRKK